MTYSHGIGHIAFGIQDQVRDTVLILIAPVPERDLNGDNKGQSVMICAPGCTPRRRDMDCDPRLERMPNTCYHKRDKSEILKNNQR